MEVNVEFGLGRRAEPPNYRSITALLSGLGRKPHGSKKVY